ncbi:DNA adenine methyltransferase YhdJ [[Flavobacterium] thermophilum]|nr:DNA adenine methyltransferase YhdJ [[Flavobacterium] thermophilum]
MLKINQTYNEDCLKFMKRLEVGVDNFNGFDLIIVDPPYYNVKGFSDAGKLDFGLEYKTKEDYLNIMETHIKEYKRLLKPNGSLWLYNSQEIGAEIDLLLQKYFTIKNRIIWYRSGGVSPNKKFKLAHEPLFYCVNDINNHTWNPDEIRIKSKYAEKDKRLNPKGKVPDDVWYIPNLVGKKKESVGHKTQKPLEICDRIILCSSNEGDLVYIPFAGSGSEIISCIKHKRNYVATEINKSYIDDMINKRIAELNKL